MKHKKNMYDPFFAQENISNFQRFRYIDHVIAHRVFHAVSYVFFLIIHILCGCLKIYSPVSNTWLLFLIVSLVFFYGVSVYEFRTIRPSKKRTLRMVYDYVIYQDLIILFCVYAFEVYNIYRIFEVLL